MTTGDARIVVFVAAAAIGLIRALESRARPATTVTSKIGGVREAVALVSSFVGFVIPIVWASTSIFAFADYPLRVAPFIAGTIGLGVSLWLFYRTHADLGSNWSSRLQVVESHQLVTTGIYNRIRHPMYLSLLLYGLAQAMVVPNWVAGPACLIGNAVLFGLRVAPEERLMRRHFGAEYDAYAARSSRLLPGIW